MIDIEALSDEERGAPQVIREALPRQDEPNWELGRCTAPSWLRDFLKPRKTIMPIMPEDNIDDILQEIEKEKEEQPAETIAKVIRDSSGTRKVQIAIPKGDKLKDDVRVQDYEIVEHELGTTTREIEYEELSRTRGHLRREAGR